jgi:hypothetical protein
VSASTSASARARCAIRPMPIMTAIHTGKPAIVNKRCSVECGLTLAAALVMCFAMCPKFVHLDDPEDDYDHAKQDQKERGHVKPHASFSV